MAAAIATFARLARVGSYRKALDLAAKSVHQTHMSEEHPDSLIPYDDVVQEALRAVVGRVLGDVAAHGLPGDHHFYITFKTHPVSPSRRTCMNAFLTK
jgi:hypothetical protein